MGFICKHFNDLTNRELYEILRLRFEIFVTEQECICQDMDRLDYDAYHVFSMENGEATSCLRVFSPEEGVAVIGRVVTKVHGQGLGGKLLHEGVLTVKKYFPDAKYIRIHAQTYAIGYYQKEGFKVTSEEFMEDGIPHVEMKLMLGERERYVMTCFLTSMPIIDEKSGAFTDVNGFLTEMRAVLKDSFRLLFVCSDPDDYESTDFYSSASRTAFEHSGFTVTEFDILDRRTQCKAHELVAKADLIVLAGGHVPTQNRFFKEIGLEKLLADFDGVLMGISAGSMNSAETVYAQPECEGEAVDPDYERFFPGLGLTKTMLLPHYQDCKDDVLDGLRVFEDIAYPDSMGREFIAVPDGSYLLIKDGSEELRGEYYLIKDGVISDALYGGQKHTLA